ncbi:Methyl-accepting chemotaxis transducer/sensory box protein [Modestobacter italicus]|uniref:Methyl-accepting chemotaxis transducer/sensory box protein n=1 Tax=Modestobacter italicus (strain DSM 44449 / CECT 9708 / BC 501) TaxID=2732864 RepID=I4F0S1_MODI5|nr:PAS domain-containing methyl-accepting chemotaxis protein [Modestobacter marinus]CCH89234.1 Methyl-accepting chemotaxis transducer/sensory box protein [Modestobacter marinus]
MPTRPTAVENLLELRGVVEAIRRTSAVVEFGLDGTVLTANQNFLDTMGYGLDEVLGKPHSMFVDPAYAASEQYSLFWRQLVDGALESGTVVKRLAKGGREVWLRSSYIPVPDEDGRPVKVIVVAIDITEGKVAALERESQAVAIDRSQAMIEFTVDGVVLSANSNFLDAMGYTLSEVRGKHHRMFVEPSLATSREYTDFWKRLGSGQFEGGVYKRLAKGGREVWLQATYNPVLDEDGMPMKIVKFASDITVARRADAESRGKVAAIDRAQAVIEFDLDGTVLSANTNFLQTMGYALPEVQGKHHSIFCEPALASSPEYEEFWTRLGSGGYESGEFKRLAKDGREVWLQATYNPILDDFGKPVKIVKFASDITEVKFAGAEARGKVAAIERAQAVVEFDLTGRVLTANQKFTDTMGYPLAEIRGKHHRIFCDPTHTASDEYADFWERLGQGHYEAGEYKRRDKDGHDVWLQATYNPIIDDSGRVVKIVKFATDITRTKRQTAEYNGKVTAMDRAQAVIEFDLDGTVLTANANFLAALGYTLAEVQGKHHRIFCDPAYTTTEEYRDFWEKLSSGDFHTGEYRRLHKNGQDVWIQASYNPILDDTGRPFKVVKFASDVTQTKLRNAEIEARVNAVDRAQAVIEFDLDGNVLSANENFLRTMGYSQREILGHHHSEFCADDYIRSPEYRDFWLRLGKGEVLAGRFHRKGKYGRDVHIQATYNPILDLSGRPFKVVKFAYDVTAEVEREMRIASGTKEMTTSVRNLSASIEDIARSSQTATGLATETQDNARQGVEALRASLEAIALIQKSSNSITEIVRVMGEIANQTNLLAFNASIEAARAGEHGVGFSIVAGEVRKLAERSFEASQQIGKLIEESAERVAQGSHVSKRAESAFEQIVSSVTRTNETIHSISASTQLQQAASREVDELIAQLASAD